MICANRMGAPLEYFRGAWITSYTTLWEFSFKLQCVAVTWACEWRETKSKQIKKPAASGTERVISSCDFTNSSTLWNVVFTVLLIPWRGPKACNYRVIWILFVVSSGGTIALFYIWRLRSHKIMFPSSPQPLQFVSCNHKQVRDMRAREKVKSVASRTCQELREKIKIVASRASQKLIEKSKSVASRACQKFLEKTRT